MSGYIPGKVRSEGADIQLEGQSQLTITIFQTRLTKGLKYYSSKWAPISMEAAGRRLALFILGEMFSPYHSEAWDKIARQRLQIYSCEWKLLYFHSKQKFVDQGVMDSRPSLV